MKRQNQIAVELFAEWRKQGVPLLVTPGVAIGLATEHGVVLTHSALLKKGTATVPLAAVAKYVAARRDA